MGPSKLRQEEINIYMLNAIRISERHNTIELKERLWVSQDDEENDVRNTSESGNWCKGYMMKAKKKAHSIINK